MSYKISRYRIPDRSTRGSTNGDDDEREVDVKITQRKGSDRNEEYRKVVYEREVEREQPRRDVRTTRIVRETERSPSPPEYTREYRRESERERPEYLEKYIRSTEYLRDDDREIQPIIIRQRAPQPIIIREEARQPIIIREQVREREEQKYEMIESRSQTGRQKQDDNDDNRSVTTHRTQRSAANKSRRQSSSSSGSEQGQEEDYWYKKTTRQVARRPNNDYEAQYRREVDPRDSASNWGGNDERESRNDRRHSEEDYYYRRTEEYGDSGGRDDDQNHRKHLAEGAALGLGAAALLRHHQGKTGQPTGGAGRLAGGAALGAIGAEAITRAANYNRENRSRSRGRGRREGRSRSRSREDGPFSGNLAKFAGIAAIGALAGYAATRGKDNKFDLGNIQKSMGLGGGATAANKARDGSGSRAGSPGALGANHEHATIVKAGLASAALAGLVDRARSKSRPNQKRSRSRALLPAVGAGLGGAALAGLYERKKNEKAAKEAPRGRSATRSRSRTKSRSRRDRSSGGDQNLVVYGGDPIPPGEEYARPRSRADSYYSQPGDRQRGGSSSSSNSDTSRRRRNRSRNRRRAESEARHDREFSCFYLRRYVRKLISNRRRTTLRTLRRTSATTRGDTKSRCREPSLRYSATAILSTNDRLRTSSRASLWKSTTEPAPESDTLPTRDSLPKRPRYDRPTSSGRRNHSDTKPMVPQRSAARSTLSCE